MKNLGNILTTRLSGVYFTDKGKTPFGALDMLDYQFVVQISTLNDTQKAITEMLVPTFFPNIQVDQFKWAPPFIPEERLEVYRSNVTATWSNFMESQAPTSSMATDEVA